MSFVSVEFIVFFSVVLILYYMLPERAQPYLLLTASLFFYGYSDFRLLLVLLFEIIVSYLIGLRISRCEARWKKMWLVVGIVCLFGLLFVFKYLNFFLSGVTRLCSLWGDERIFFVNIVLPIGISFYTFQAASYLIDLFIGAGEPEKRILYYALYLSFFPQLVAGPIERADTLIPQFKKQHIFNAEDFSGGISLILAGYVKKVVIADTASRVVNSVFGANNLSDLDAISIILATLLFVLQIYGDFSGYTDIARGSAKMMGINLSENFNKPFAALSVTEFWKRWHITLSTWFYDYIYMPLSYQTIGKKHHKLFHVAILMLTFALSGLWHGADVTYLLWGILHGTYNAVEAVTGSPTRKNSKLYNKFRQTITFLLIAISMMLFRAETLNDFTVLLKGVLINWSFDILKISNECMLSPLLCAELLLLPFLYMWIDEGLSRYNGSLCDQGIICETRFVVLPILITVFWLLNLSQGTSSAFLYFQF